MGKAMKISRPRAAAYTLAVIVLAVLNVVYWNSGEASLAGRAGENVNRLPPLDLQLAKSRAVMQASFARDIFQFTAKATVRVTAPPVVETEEPAFDPSERIRDEIVKQFKTIRFLGSLKVDDGYVALLEREGETMLLQTGAEVMPGFDIGFISSDTLNIKNRQIAFEARYSLDGEEPVFIPGDAN